MEVVAALVMLMVLFVLIVLLSEFGRGAQERPTRDKLTKLQTSAHEGMVNAAASGVRASRRAASAWKKFSAQVKERAADRPKQ